MYLQHFGLHTHPFRNTPDSRFFFPGAKRGEILDALVYAIQNGEGIIKVVGEVGSGKTMLCRMLEERLPDSVVMVYLANPSIPPDQVVHAIAVELRIQFAPGLDRIQVMQAVQAFLLEKHANNQRVVVFVEEAQGMPLATLEEIRLLSNLETKHSKLLQIVLFGQPELNDNLEEKGIRQLKERISFSFELAPISGHEIQQYLDFRMRVAGYHGPSLFHPRTVRRIARISMGLTRRINLLADKAMLVAYTHQSNMVLPKHIEAAAQDSEFIHGDIWGVDRSRWILLGTGLLLSLSLAFGLGYYFAHTPAPLPAETPAHPEPTPPTVVPPAPAVEPPVVTEPTPTVSEPTPTPPGPETAAPPASAPVPAEPDPVSVPTPTPKSAPAMASTPAPLPMPEVPPHLPAPVLEGAVTPPPHLLRPAPTPPEEKVPAPQEESTATPLPPPSAQEPSPPVEHGLTTSGLTPRFTEADQWLKEVDRSRFTIQLLAVPQGGESVLKDFLKRHDDKSDQLHVRRLNNPGQPMLIVYYGDFASYAEAQEALKGLPESFRAFNPYVRSLKVIVERSGRL